LSDSTLQVTKLQSVPIVNNTAADISIERLNPLSDLWTKVKGFYNFSEEIPILRIKGFFKIEIELPLFSLCL